MTKLMVAEPIVGELLEPGSYCPQCGSGVDPHDAYCSRCGLALPRANIVEQPERSELSAVERTPQLPSLLERRSVVIGLLLFAGPLGLPAMWLSPRFSLPTKVITSLVYAGVTIILPIALAFYWLHIAMLPLVDAFPPTTH